MMATAGFAFGADEPCLPSFRLIVGVMGYIPNSAAGSSVKKLSRKNLLCLPPMSTRNLPTLSNISITASNSDVLCLATKFLSDGERAGAWLTVITIMGLSNEHIVANTMIRNISL